MLFFKNTHFRYVRLSLPRIWIRDLVYFAAKSPVVGGSSTIKMAKIAAARRNCQPLISWSAILVKAIALTAKQWPALRRTYMPLPWPHLYQHPHSIATVVLEREWQGEYAVFFDQIHAPEQMSLRELDSILRAMKRTGVERRGGFRRLIRVSRYPWPLRRLIWRFALYVSGRLKARYFGTFSINSLSSRRMRVTQSITPVTLSLEYSPLMQNDDMPIQIFIDHRVMDGTVVNRIIADIESVLNAEIVTELYAITKASRLLQRLPVSSFSP